MSLTWKEGLDSIEKKQYKYRYFNLLNPPKKGSNKKNYLISQKLIDNEFDEIRKKFDDIFEGSLKNKSDTVGRQLNKKRENVLDREQGIYNKTKQGTKPYMQMTDEERVYFWTKYFYGINNQSQNYSKWSNKKCFSFVIRSLNFYNELKSSGNEIFTRHMLLEGGKKELNSTIKLKELNDIVTKLEERLPDTFSNTGAEYITAEIGKALQSFMSNSKDKDLKISAFGKAKNYIKKEKTEYNAAALSVNLREDIRKIITEQKLGKDFVYELKNTNNKVILRVVASDQKENKLSEAQKNIENLRDIALNGTPEEKKEASEKLINSIVKTFAAAMESMKSSTNILELNSLGSIDLNASNKKQIFFDKAIAYARKELPKFLRGQGMTTILKTLIAARSNTFISELCGELSGALTFTKETQKVQMTGNVYGEIGGSKFGGSVNDLTVKNSKLSSSNYGVNIKHYVRSQNSITLYNSSKNSLSIYSAALRKYFSTDEIDIMRWATENLPFLIKNKKVSSTFNKQLAYYFSWKEMPSFLRIEDKTENSVVNIFYQINNVIYPASYIYREIIKELNKILSMNNTKSSEQFFNIKQKRGNDNLISYENRSQAIRTNQAQLGNSLYKDKYFIGEKSNIGADLNIQVKGLKFNLLQLNLLK